MTAVPATFARTPTLRALEQLLSDELSLDVVGLDPESTLDELGSTMTQLPTTSRLRLTNPF